MKKIAALLIATIVIVSCSKKDKGDTSNPSTNSYKLIEILADPGDGSGTFQPVNSNKTIEFKTNGTVTSNGELCDMSTSSAAPSSGTYSLVDSTITSSNCSDLPFKIKGNYLILFYPCIEPCQGKFEKI